MVEESVVVRRRPRFVNFMLLGALLGVVAALALTFMVPSGSSEEQRAVAGDDIEYSTGQVFGFLLLAAVPIGIALGALAAIVLDRVIGRRARTVVAQNIRTGSVEVHSEAETAHSERATEALDAGPAVQPPTTKGPAA
ncbi:hypothetical protein GCM10027416_32950 [Okibacterium endophyticum]